MTLYMKVSKDKYELPLAIADNAQELASMCGVTVGTIFSQISRSKTGRRSPYHKVEIEEDDDAIN